MRGPVPSRRLTHILDEFVDKRFVIFFVDFALNHLRGDIQRDAGKLALHIFERSASFNFNFVLRSVFYLLGEVCKLLADNPDYVRLIKDKAIAKTERLALLDGAFSGQIHPYLLNFMKLLCERGAFGEMAACQAEYISCYNEKHGIVPAKVFSAEALSDEQLARLKAALERTSGKHVTLDVHVDATLVGGMRVEMAGKSYDNTLESRMDHLRRVLAARS